MDGSSRTRWALYQLLGQLRRKSGGRDPGSLTRALPDDTELLSEIQINRQRMYLVTRMPDYRKQTQGPEPNSRDLAFHLPAVQVSLGEPGWLAPL